MKNEVYMSALASATGRNLGNHMTGGDVIPKGHKAGQLQQFTPEQMDLFKNLFSQVQPGSYLSKLAGGDQEAFGQLEAPALKQFNALQGNLASRFSGMGMGARRSSGFQNAANEASSDFAQQLQSQRMAIQRQALQDLMGISGELLGQRPYDRFVIEKQQKPSLWKSLLHGGLTLAGGIGGGLAGGPMGAVAGSQLGSQIGSAFSGSSFTPSYSGIGELPKSWEF